VIVFEAVVVNSALPEAVPRRVVKRTQEILLKLKLERVHADPIHDSQFA
jgi:hypothetical protein